MGIFTDLFSTQPAQDAAAAKIAGLNTANTNAGTALTAGQTGADALYGQAQGNYNTLASSTAKGSAAYGDATGANGADGLARAKAQYQSDPGYSGGLTTGIDQLDRTAAQRGQLGGGNTAADTIKFASDYDANKYGSYVSGLAPYLGANSSAVAGQASTLGAQAGTDMGVAGQKATNAYNTASGIGNANADAAMAPYTASSNFWSALGGAAKLGVSAFTGIPSLGGGGSSGGAGYGNFGQYSPYSPANA
jgi:hypothetical protein